MCVCVCVCVCVYIYIYIRGVVVCISCIERFTGKFQLEVIIPIPLEWGLWSE